MSSLSAQVPDAVLSVSGICKSFDGVPALDSVDMTVRPGRVHALLGGNGSGKSTLIKTLAGVYSADSGSVSVNGSTFHGHGELTPTAAAASGLRFVHQELGLLDDFSVAENLALEAGYPVGTTGIRWRELDRWATTILQRFDIDADPRDLVGSLRPSTRTMVAIARALRSGGGERGSILVLDEPTASLPDVEVELLMDALRRRVAGGDTIIYVSHRISEVLGVADDFTVLRDGRNLATGQIKDVDERGLVELIAGRALSPTVRTPSTLPKPSRMVLSVTGLSVGPLSDVALEVRAGEIVGVTGLLGSGRSTLLRSIAGHTRIRSGKIVLDGNELHPSHVAARVAAGVALVPEDRGAEAALPDLPVRENLSISVLSQFFGHTGLKRREELRESDALVKSFGIRLHSVDQPFTTLSGGNQQKAVIARWLRRDPRILMLDEPTQGVDVGARADIYDLLRDAARRGTAILVVSSDTEELCELCDRVIVLRGGKVVAELDAHHTSPSALVQLSYHDSGESA